MVYQWKDGAQIKADAQVAAAMCMRLEADGNLTAKALLDANRAEDAPLHDEFEWDDTVAAEAYRETQAGHIIRSLIVVNETSQPVRGFLKIDRSERSYQSINAIIQSKDATDQLLASALKELQAFQRKYSALSELAEVFAAIDKTGGSIGKTA